MRTMCGRYSFASSKEKVNKQFGLNIEQSLQASYNIAPTHSAYVITNNKPKELQRFNWGLIPYWAQNPKIGANLINARSESISGKPSFRMSIRKRRCLVLADGFYEWRKEGTKRIPYRIVLTDNSVIAFGGIWDQWQTPSGAIANTFSIITTKANREMQQVHNRMPIIFQGKERQKAWLEETNLELILSMLQPLDNDMLKIFPVSQKVNSPNNNDASLYGEIQLPPTLF